MVSATKSFALYLGKHGIQVNAVAPARSTPSFSRWWTPGAAKG